MRSQKRLPRRRARRCGWHTVGLQDARDRRSPDLVPEILEGTLNARVAPRRIVPGHASTSCRISAKTPERLLRLLGYVHLRATSCRCQRSSVSGVTIVATSRKACRPSLWARMASRRRSSSVNRSRRPPTCCRDDAILFDQIGERLPLPAIEPTGDGEEQQPKDRLVDHERELISRTGQESPQGCRF